MKTLLHTSFVTILFLGIAGSSFSSERGGNTGGNEELEKAVYEHKIFGQCSISADTCSVASKYLNEAIECHEKDSLSLCDFYADVNAYSSACCPGL